MQCLFVLFLVAISQGLGIRKTLPVPKHLSLTTLEPKALLLQWTPVESEEPILGYKVKVWELPEKTIYKYKTEGGKEILVPEVVHPKIDDDTPPESEAKEFVVTGANATSIMVDKIKANVIYELSVRAYSASQDGPLSTGIRVELLEPNVKEEDHKED